MKRFISVPKVIATFALLLILINCKINVEKFSITGTWEVKQRLTYNDDLKIIN